jgi:hypothetical protein
MEMQESAFAKAMAGMAKLTYQDESFNKKAMDMQHSVFSRATVALAGRVLDDSFTKRAMDTNNSAISKAMAAVAKLSYLDDSLIKDAVERPHYPDTMMTENAKLDTGSESIFLAAIDLGRRTGVSQSPVDVKRNINFSETFKTLPLWDQHFVIWVILNIFLGALEDIAKEKLLETISKTDSYIESLTKGKALSQTEIVSNNEEINWGKLKNF